MREVEITREPVELYKILKFEGVVSSGGEAKSIIDNGQVMVNGKVETRRRKKIISGDIKFINQTLKDLHPSDVANLIENLSSETRAKLIELEDVDIDPEIFIEIKQIPVYCNLIRMLQSFLILMYGILTPI